MTEPAEDTALIPLPASDADPEDVPPALATLYRTLPPAVVAVVEGHRIGMLRDILDHLRAVREALAPFGAFKDWVEACGFTYSSVYTALDRADNKRGIAHGATVSLLPAADMPPEFVEQVAATAPALWQAVKHAQAQDPEAAATVMQDLPKLVTSSYRSGVKSVQYDRATEQRKALLARTAPNFQQDRYRIETCDIHDLAIEPGSVAAVITDPPYPFESVPLYRTVAEQAKTWLKPGGALVVMAGKEFVNFVFRALDEGIGEENYDWTVDYRFVEVAHHSRRRTRQWGKYVIVYRKPPYDPYTSPLGVYDDKIEPVAADKNFHHWGQDTQSFVYLVDKFTLPDELVCDPFLGAGTTAIAALLRGRRFIGCDDCSFEGRDWVAISRSRVQRVRIAEALKKGTFRGTVRRNGVVLPPPRPATPEEWAEDEQDILKQEALGAEEDRILGELY